MIVNNFSDLLFIFRFMPVFFIIYIMAPPKRRSLVLCLGSLVFYAFGDVRFLAVLLAAVIINYAAGKFTFEENRIMLIIIAALDAGMLMTFKILSQYVNSSLLPLGISFFTFKMISYQADLYMGKFRKQPSLLRTATYFVMFPQIISGPIMRYDPKVKNKLWLTRKRDKSFGRRVADGLSALEDGLSYFIAGLAMKVLVADRFAMFWNEIGRIGYDSLSTPLAWLGAAGYSMNLYFDFWGYSLMAGGLGVALGYPFITNFDQPYAADSVRDFYRRWHATLGAWFRDYVYIPLGGSRCGEAAVIRNLFVVWLLTGIWHGITFNFILWGMLLFAIICWERFLAERFPGLFKVLGRLHVYILIPLTWVIFAINDFRRLGQYFSRLFPFFGGSGIEGDFVRILGTYKFLFLIGFLLMIPQLYQLFLKYRKNKIVTVLLLILFWYCVSVSANSAGNPFMYFKF